MRIPKAALGLLVVGFLLVQPARAQEEKNLTFTEALDRDGTLLIDTYKGSVVVTTWDRDEVQAAVRIVPDGTEGLVESTTVRVHRTGRTLRFESEYDEDAWDDLRKHGLLGLFSNGYSSPFVHYEIRMPRTARLEIDDHKSEIRVTNLASDLVIDTHKGDVEVDNLSGGLRLDTYKGTVRVHFSRLTDDSLVETYKGDVTLVLDEDAAFDLDADIGRKGDLNADFALRDRRRDSDRRWRDDDGDRVYRTAVNGGGPRLRMETYKGYLAVRHR